MNKPRVKSVTVAWEYDDGSWEHRTVGYGPGEEPDTARDFPELLPKRARGRFAGRVKLLTEEEWATFQRMTKLSRRTGEMKGETLARETLKCAGAVPTLAAVRRMGRIWRAYQQGLRELRAQR